MASYDVVIDATGGAQQTVRKMLLLLSLYRAPIVTEEVSYFDIADQLPSLDCLAFDFHSSTFSVSLQVAEVIQSLDLCSWAWSD